MKQLIEQNKFYRHNITKNVCFIEEVETKYNNCGECDDCYEGRSSECKYVDREPYEVYHAIVSDSLTGLIEMIQIGKNCLKILPDD